MKKSSITNSIKNYGKPFIAYWCVVKIITFSLCYFVVKFYGRDIVIDNIQKLIDYF